MLTFLAISASSPRESRIVTLTHGHAPWVGNLEAFCLCPSFPKGAQEQDQCGQATKGMWGMSWRQKAMKGVEDCEKPGVAVNRALIPGFPNYRALNP